jgi:hypothetical protein
MWATEEIFRNLKFTRKALNFECKTIGSKVIKVWTLT